MNNEYAEIINGTVNQVLVVDGTETEAIAWLKANVSTNTWIKSVIIDENGESVATRDGEYNSQLGHFIRKKPFNNWILDENRLMYIPPLPKPIAVPIGYMWVWIQDLGQWVQQRIDRI